MGNISDLNNDVAGWMAWLQFAILFVPVVISSIYFEWQDWRLERPRMARRPTTQPRWKPAHPFAMPM
jgi:hypothetical protein